MDTFLFAITGISLAIALLMTVAAWRLRRVERERSAARVAALAAAATNAEDEFPSEQAIPRAARRAEAMVTREPAVARDAATVDSAHAYPERSRAMAVNEVRPAAPWAPARVSVFPAESHEARFNEAPDRMRDVAAPAVSRSTDARASMSDGFLGSAVAAPASGGPQRSLAYAACALFLVIVTGGYFTLFGGASNQVSAAAGASATATPLELVSLRHERQGPRLSITGLVRNPVKGATADHLTAVVFLFDQQSAFLTSARANIDVTRLTPGDESPFVIALDAPANVARYRVSFRTDSGVVPHVDRRGQEPIARELP